MNNDSNNEPMEEIKEDKEDKKAKKSNNLTMLRAKKMTETELKEALRAIYSDNNVVYNTLKGIVDAFTKKYTTKLYNLITVLKIGISPTYKKDDNGRIIDIKFERKISDMELENLNLLLTAEMAFITEVMDDAALDNELTIHLKDFHITEQTFSLIGATASERQKAGEYNSMEYIFSALIKQRVYYNLKNSVDAATKVYDAIKKVLSSRIEEKKRL